MRTRYGAAPSTSSTSPAATRRDTSARPRASVTSTHEAASVRNWITPPDASPPGLGVGTSVAVDVPDASDAGTGAAAMIVVTVVGVASGVVAVVASAGKSASAGAAAATLAAPFGAAADA